MTDVTTAADKARTIVNDQPPFGRWIGTRFIEVAPDRIVTELTVREDMTNRNGVMHGGALMALADNLGGTATFLNLPEGAATTTIESKTNFFAACPIGETIRTETTPLHRGRTTMVWQTKILRADGKLAALVTQTQMVLGKKG